MKFINLTNNEILRRRPLSSSFQSTEKPRPTVGLQIGIASPCLSPISWRHLQASPKMKFILFIFSPKSDGIPSSKDEGINTRFGRESRQPNPMEGSWLKSLLCDATSGRGSASRASKMDGVMFRIFFPIFTTDNIADTQNALGFFKHQCEQTSLPLQPECGPSRRCFPTQQPRTRLSQMFGALFLEHLSHSSAELEWHDAFDNNTDFLSFFL
jgi:hypothetical protein